MLWVIAVRFVPGVHADIGEPAESITAHTIALEPVLVPVPSSPGPGAFFQQVSTVAQGLRSPDGLARDAESGDIYVTEENAATIVRISPDGSKQVMFDSTTPLYEDTGTDISNLKRVEGLRSPEGLALDGNGILYVVEDTPGGRLISFPVGKRRGDPAAYGTVIPIPMENSLYAWESVDVGPAGELLVAGSTVESFPRSLDQPGLFRGAVLYRNADGEWWMPMNEAMTGYSAASFSPDGALAYFACEISGDVGCFDLNSKTLRAYHAKLTFHSPEGLCVLPDGSALVVEEEGKIYRLDPISDTTRLLYDNRHTVESVEWDAPNHRLLVTDDQQGLVLSLELKPGIDVRSLPNLIRKIQFEEELIALEMIPDECPDYLSRILELGGFDPLQEAGDLGFRDFARKYCLVAIDARTLLLPHSIPVEDPIKQIQIVIVAPYRIGAQGGQLIWSSSGFAAIKESGQIIKTQMVERQAIKGDLMEASFFPMGGQQIALPMPFSSQIDADGLASIHFMGMGVTSDYLLILNTLQPDQSCMLVMKPNERPQLYSLYLPPGQNDNYWVIALERKAPARWTSLPVEPQPEPGSSLVAPE